MSWVALGWAGWGTAQGMGAHHPTRPAGGQARERNGLQERGESELLPLNPMMCPPLLATLLPTLPGCWARHFPAQLSCVVWPAPKDKSRLQPSLPPRAEQAGAGGTGRPASSRRGLWQLARWETFSRAGAEGETRTLNKAEPKVVRPKEAERNPFSCSGQNRPRMDASRTG